MQKMGKEQEQRLLSDISAIQANVDSGSNPTDALYKVAVAADLSDDMIRLLGTMYNNGRTIAQLRNPDVHEKSAAFPVADPDAVINKLAASRPLLPAEKDRCVSVSQVYSLDVPDWATKEEDTAKAARLATPLQERYRAMDKAAGKAYVPPVYQENPLAELRDARLELRHAEDAYSSSMYKLANGLDQLTSFFANTQTKLADVDAVISKVYGTVGATIMDRMAESLPTGCFRLQMTKDASLVDAVIQRDASKHDWRKTAQPMRVDWNATPFTLIANCVDLCKQAAALRDAVADRKQELTEKAASVSDALIPREPKACLWEEIDRPLEKRAGPLVPMLLAGTAGRYMGGMGDAAKADEQKQMDSISGQLRQNDPVLSEIKTRTMLANMMRSDDVLQGYPEEDIANAFNTLVDMAPSAMGQQAIAQNALRRYLAQESLDGHDADQLLKLDSQLRTPAGGQAGQRMTAATMAAS